MALSSSAFGSNVPYVYGLENVCQPCSMNATARAAAMNRHPSEGMAMAQSARVSPIHLVDPSVSHRDRVVAAVNHTNLSGMGVTPKLSQTLAGYTAGVRVANLSQY
jgi:hypothetical protein